CDAGITPARDSSITFSIRGNAL
ncbi:hypothetical protein D018_1596B, partial [Vibrio parahaemolyticus VP2007-007]